MARLDDIDAREKGAVPVSIGTSLALEAADGHYPERPEVNPPPILSVELLLVNLRTVFRNFVGALHKDLLAELKPQHFVKPFLEELRIIESFVKERSNGQCAVLYYLSHYEHLTPSVFPGALFKEAVTLKQKVDHTREDDFFKLLVKTDIDVAARIFDGPIEGKYGKTFIITHLPVDLLQRRLFSKLELLETHSGNIKPRGLWGTKLNGRDMENIPLNAFTLKVFGDGVQFVGQRTKLKQAVLDVALLDHWTGLSTDALIRHSITKVSDLELQNTLKTLL